MTRRGFRQIATLPAAPDGVKLVEVEVAGASYQVPASSLGGGLASIFNQYTALQCPFSSDFADLKGNLDTETGTVAIAADGNVPSGFSAQFSGAGGRVQFPSAASLNFGNGNFTLGGWFRTSMTTQYGALFTRDQGSTEAWTCLVNIDSASDGKIAFYQLALGQVVKTSGGGYNNGVRHHIEITRNGCQFSIWIDGLLAGTTQYVSFDVFAVSTSGLQFGNSQTAARAFLGALDNWYIMKGIALHTVPFTVPVPPLPTS